MRLTRTARASCPCPCPCHGHSHVLTPDGINKRMGIAVVLNLVFVVIESSFGFLSNSVALIADAGHNLGDVLGLICAWPPSC